MLLFAEPTDIIPVVFHRGVVPIMIRTDYFDDACDLYDNYIFVFHIQLFYGG